MKSFFCRVAKSGNVVVDVDMKLQGVMNCINQQFEHFIGGHVFMSARIWSHVLPAPFFVCSLQFQQYHFFGHTVMFVG